MCRKTRRAEQFKNSKDIQHFPSPSTRFIEYVLDAHEEKGKYQRTVEYMNECKIKDIIPFAVTHNTFCKSPFAFHDKREDIFHVEGNLDEQVHIIKLAQALDNQIIRLKGPSEELSSITNERIERRISIRNFNEAKERVPQTKNVKVFYNPRHCKL